MKRPENSPRSNLIAISVVVPVRNEANSIRGLLESLQNQTLPPDEIVITDGGSVDSTIEIIQEFIAAGAPVKLIREANALPGRGRNIGVQHARNEWIAFTDGGNRLAADWLEKLASEVSDKPLVDLVYGSYEPVDDSFFQECAAIAYVAPAVEVDGTLARSKFIASTLVRKSVWEAVGGFPEELRSGEDLLFMNRIESQGFRHTQAPRAVVYWEIQPNLWRTFRRFVVYARNNIRAGFWRNWQAPIFRRYTVIGFLAVPAIFAGLKWLLVPLFLWVALLMARAARALYRNRFCYPAGLLRTFFRFILIVPIIATLDLATFAGSLKWLFLDWPETTSNDSHR